jgi:membrane-associated phospholipid phosphatase
MTRKAAARPKGGGDRGRRYPDRLPPRGSLLPRGGGDLVRQLAIWLGFVLAYETARGLARPSSSEAQRNARDVITIEKSLGAFFEPSLQHRAIGASHALVVWANSTYWIAEFAVLTVVLCWIYVRHTKRYFVVRNALIATNLIGYVGYIFLPTAPPRLVPGYGFVDTLAQSSFLNHSTRFVEVAANRYAAMPSLHVADALVIGIAMSTLVHNRLLRCLFLVWPVWVTFSLIITANHFWLDAAAGALVALLGGGIAIWAETRLST